MRSVRNFVANTDFDWFTFLGARQPLDEVNFWQPSAGPALLREHDENVFERAVA
jgi:hypothetical protein